MAFVAHFVLQRPSPLQRTGLTLAFLPWGLVELYRAVRARGDACPAGDAFALVHLAYRAGSDDRIVGEEREGPACGAVGLVDRLRHELGVVGKAAR